jgi:hypothetical protein
MRFTIYALVILDCAISVFARNAATCQTPATESRLEAGTRVRVSSSAPGFFGPPMVGNVLAQRGDSLSLRPERTQDSITLPLASISQLEVSAGRHSQIGKGMGLGFLSGALIGAVTGAASASKSPFSAGEAAAIVGLTGGFLGISVGGAIGAMWRTEDWERVSAVGGRKIGFRLAPSATGGLNVSAIFALAKS